MKKVKYLAILFIVVPLLTQTGADAQWQARSIDVKVTNTPLPVTGTVTGTVSGSVSVVNPNSKPIPVTEVRKYPVQKGVSSKFSGIWWVTVETLYKVPVDKLLVIEYFSCQSSGSYSTSYSCNLTTGEYPGVDHFLPSTPYGHSKIIDELDPTKVNPEAYMSAGQRVQIYAEPGTDVLAGAYRQNQAIMNVGQYSDEWIQFSFSGYLLDIAP